MTVLDSRSPARSIDSGALDWTPACTVDVLTDNRGVAVLLKGGEQAALFRLADGRLFAVGNIDPFARAAVMSRGIVGDRDGEPTVASPLLKQVFSLVDGRCLDDPAVSVASYPVDVDGAVIRIGRPHAVESP